MKARVITARINDTLNYEIEFLKASLGLANTTSVLTHAIHTLYTSTREKQSQKSSLEMFEEKGLMGCIEAAPNLSTTYKDKIPDFIMQKHSQPSKSKQSLLAKKNKKTKST